MKGKLHKNYPELYLMKGPVEVVKKAIEGLSLIVGNFLTQRFLILWQDQWWIGWKQLLRLMDGILNINFYYVFTFF